jgi:hypothetical protein
VIEVIEVREVSEVSEEDGMKALARISNLGCTDHGFGTLESSEHKMRVVQYAHVSAHSLKLGSVL